MELQLPRAVTVYCGSAANLPQRFLDAATELGVEMARADVALVYGAGRTGLMGAVADAVLANEGRVVGVIPSFMVERGWNHAGLDEMIVTDGMHPRKTLMAQKCCGAIALPGGIGTFEELTELITWRQLGLYSGNIVILNVDGYYDALLSLFDKAVECGFMNADHKNLYRVATTPQQALEMALAPIANNSFSAKF